MEFTVKTKRTREKYSGGFKKRIRVGRVWEEEKDRERKLNLKEKNNFLFYNLEELFNKQILVRIV